jgi:hypothetical protein
VSRLLDRGAITAAYVGIGMAVTIAISFLLVIPIEPVYWYVMLPAGVLVGYYANQRSDRRLGPWRRIMANAAGAGIALAVTAVVLLLLVKALFFFADSGYRDAGQGGPLTCSPGADCVYQRYLDEGYGDRLSAAGVTDAAAFSAFYWNQQLATGAFVFSLALGGGLVGGLLYGWFRPRGRTPEPSGTRRPEHRSEPLTRG